MSHIWMRDPQRAWYAFPLEAPMLRLDDGTPRPMAECDLHRAGGAVILAHTQDARGLEQWSLLCTPGSATRVNGAPVRAGIRVLADRDAVTLGDGTTVFFSSERLAHIVPFPGEGHGTCCYRCRIVLEPGTPAVRCPAPDCGFWHHQSADYPCWTYTDACPGCGHPTAFDAGYQWSPRDL